MDGGGGPRAGARRGARDGAARRGILTGRRMFIVFEGIDGSGKTTISNRVAKLLRRRGRAVAHVREGGEFAQPLVSRLREFGKDRRNFELEPVAELLLYAAREAQLIADAVRPALASHDLVFADRYLYSCEVLACDGRGLARDIVRPIVDATACGLWPDLVVLCDADPHIARARRKARKIAKTAAGPRDDRGGGSRKSLGGVGMAHRMRSGYLALAAREPARWLVVDNTWSRLDDVVDRVVGVIDAIASGAPVADAIARARAAPFASPPAADEPTAGAAARAFFAFVEDRAEREPGVAAYLLSGLDDDRAWALRRQLAADEPALVAYSIRGMNSEAAWQLRAALVDDAPYQVARSLAGNAVDPRRAADLRERLAAHQPLGVVASLRGDATEAAWRLRRRLADAHLLAVVASLAGD
ncbi:MAG: dTMP kinase, partial [Deltaproteobacteria bacterium]